MSRQAAHRLLDSIEARLDAMEQVRSEALLDRMTLEELDELERLIEAGDEQALDALWARVAERVYRSGAGV